MRTWIKPLLVFLLSIPALAANDFSGDGNCKALWKFENGALTADSKGGNTLTAVNSPVADTVNYKEGSASVDLELGDTDYFYINDGDLDAGYPLKSGDSTKNISICFWLKPESFSTYHYVYTKETAAGNGTVQVDVDNLGRVRLSIYQGAGDSETATYGTAMTTGKWYHVGCTYRHSDKSYRIRIWDDTASSILGSELTGTFTKTLQVVAGSVVIGAPVAAALGFLYDGLIDEMVVFNDVLSSDEIDQIRAGTYGAASGAGAGVIIINMD